jgi:phage shock protein A
MATLLEKVSTLISANLHALVDKALESNSMAVIDQYIRQVEDNLENLEDAAATVGGEIKTITRKLEGHKEKAHELDRAIDAFLMDGNDTAAAASQSRLNSTESLISTYQEQLERQEAEFQKLLDAKVKLEARLATMKQQREELQAILELAKSKEIVVKTMKSLDDFMGSGDSDISKMAEKIYARLDKATTAAEMRSISLDEQMDEILDRQAIDAQLAERKERLELESKS